MKDSLEQIYLPEPETPKTIKPRRGRPAKKVEEEEETPKPKRGRPSKKVEVEEEKSESEKIIDIIDLDEEKTESEEPKPKRRGPKSLRH